MRLITMNRLKAYPKGGEYARRSKTRAPRVVHVKSAEKGPRIVTDATKRKKLASFMMIMGLRDSDNPKRSGIAMCEWARANGANLEGYVHQEQTEYSKNPIMEYLMVSSPDSKPTDYRPILLCDPDGGCIFDDPSSDDESHTVGAYAAKMNENVLALCWLLEQGVPDPDLKIIESLFGQAFYHYSTSWMRWIIKHGTAKQEWFEEARAHMMSLNEQGSLLGASVGNEQFLSVLDEGLASFRQVTLDAVLPVARQEVQAGTRRF